MDKDRIKGAADKFKGNIKETTGKVTGNERLETEGKVDQFKGGVREGFGKAKDAVKETRNDVNDAFNNDDDEPNRR
jgi:uncharacterized protein YjbJ (UPF0337 family)